MPFVRYDDPKLQEFNPEILGLLYLIKTRWRFAKESDDCASEIEIVILFAQLKYDELN